MITLEPPGLLQLVTLVFFLLVIMQFVVLLVNVHALAREDLVGELYAFLDEYWSWAHIRSNILTLSVWLSSLFAFVASFWALNVMEDWPVTRSWQHHPLVTGYIFLSLLVFACYGLYRAMDQLRQTQEICIQLKKLKRFNWFRRALHNLQHAPVLSEGMGQVPRIVVKTTHWMTEKISSHMINRQLHQAAARFFLTASLESLFRLTSVACALWIVSG